MSIKQFNASYLVHEDRIMFRFNTHEDAEYRLWFTRRVTLFILAATSHLLTKQLEKNHSSDAAKAMSEFEKQAMKDSSATQIKDIKTFESGTNFPIGADALLVMEVSCSLAKNNEKLAFIHQASKDEIDDALSIDFVLPGGANLNLKLSESLLQGMCLLLDQLRQNAGWGEAVLQEKHTAKTDQNIDTKAGKSISIH